MSLFNFFKKIIIDAKNKQAVSTLDSLFKKAEDMCLIAEKLETSALEKVDDDFINTINSLMSSLENTIYNSLVSSFISTMNASLLKQDAEQVEPLVKKWSFRASNQKISLAEYLEFMTELRELSDKCSVEFNGKMSLMGVQKKIEKNMGKAMIEKRLGQVKNRMSNCIARAGRANEIMLSTNFVSMSPFDFEHFVAKLFNSMGYEAQATSRTGDYGVDVIAKKDAEIIAIQCKKYQEGNNVGNQEVQRLLGAMLFKDLKADRGIIITTSDFTRQAGIQAEDNPIELRNKTILHNAVRKYLIQD